MMDEEGSIILSKFLNYGNVRVICPGTIVNESVVEIACLSNEKWRSNGIRKKNGVKKMNRMMQFITPSFSLSHLSLSSRFIFPFLPSSLHLSFKQK